MKGSNVATALQYGNNGRFVLYMTEPIFWPLSRFSHRRTSTQLAAYVSFVHFHDSVE